MRHKAFYINTAWQYMLTMVRYLLPLIVMPYLTRVLEPSGYAVYAYVAAFMGFVQVFVDFGFNLSGTKSIARASDADEENRIVGAITQARLLLCCIVGVCCGAISVFLPIIRENPLYSILAFIAVCGRGVAPDFLFQGKEKMGPITTRYLVSKGTSTALTFLMVHSFADILWVPLLDILASGIALVWSFAVARRMFGTRLVRVSFAESMAELMRSGYYCLSNMASASFTGLTTLIIGLAVVDPVQIAYWSVAMTAVSAVQALYAPITNSLYAHMVANGDFGFARRIALLSAPVMAVGVTAFVLLSDAIVAIIGGDEYMAGSYVVRGLSPVLVFSFYGMYFGWPVLGALGRVKELTATTFLSAAFGICALVCAWSFGGASLTAFCISRSMTEVLMCGLRMVACYRALRGVGRT